MKKSHFIFISLFLFTSIDLLAGIRLPAVISSNMVLQQQSKATLWGWGDPGETPFRGSAATYVTKSSGPDEFVAATLAACGC